MFFMYAGCIWINGVSTVRHGKTFKKKKKKPFAKQLRMESMNWKVANSLAWTSQFAGPIYRRLFISLYEAIFQCGEGLYVLYAPGFKRWCRRRSKTVPGSFFSNIHRTQSENEWEKTLLYTDQSIKPLFLCSGVYKEVFVSLILQH